MSKKGGIINPAGDLIGSKQKSVDERIKEEALKAEEAKKNLRKVDFKKQLEEFKHDNSFVKEYEDNLESIKEDYILLRLFKFMPSEESAPKSGVLTLDQATGKYVPKEEVLDAVLTNFAKIIMSGHRNFESGQVVTLPYDSIRGFYKNPEWEQYLESFRTKGATPILPKDSRELIPAYEVQMKDKMFVRPWLLEDEPEDRLTYLVNSFEIETVVKK